MEAGGSNVRSSYYNVLGIRKDASVSDVRAAYRKLAMVPSSTAPSKYLRFFFFDQFSFYLTYLMKKWHPDRYARNPGVAGEAKRRFQQIQEAYSGHFTLFSPSLKISS